MALPLPSWTPPPNLLELLARASPPPETLFPVLLSSRTQPPPTQVSFQLDPKRKPSLDSSPTSPVYLLPYSQTVLLPPTPSTPLSRETLKAISQAYNQKASTLFLQTLLTGSAPTTGAPSSKTPHTCTRILGNMPPSYTLTSQRTGSRPASPWRTCSSSVPSSAGIKCATLLRRLAGSLGLTRLSGIRAMKASDPGAQKAMLIAMKLFSSPLKALRDLSEPDPMSSLTSTKSVIGSMVLQNLLPYIAILWSHPAYQAPLCLTLAAVLGLFSKLRPWPT